MADDSTVAAGGGVQRWTLTGSTWARDFIMVDPGGTPTGVRGLLATPTGTSITLVAVTTEVVANRIVKFVDPAGSTTAATGTVIATATPLTVYRGVALAPQR